MVQWEKKRFELIPKFSYDGLCKQLLSQCLPNLNEMLVLYTKTQYPTLYLSSNGE